jgi:hypothetical protein
MPKEKNKHRSKFQETLVTSGEIEKEKATLEKKKKDKSK